MKKKSKLKFLWGLLPVSMIVPIATLTSCTNPEESINPEDQENSNPNGSGANIDSDNTVVNPGNEYSINEKYLYDDLNNVYHNVFNSKNRNNNRNLLIFKNQALAIINRDDHFKNSISNDQLEVIPNDKNGVDIVIKFGSNFKYNKILDHEHVNLIGNQLYVDSIGNGNVINPDIPSKPENPGTDWTPSNPVQPNPEPEKPTPPSKPENPGIDWTPVKPSQPVKPSEPSQPVEPPKPTPQPPVSNVININENELFNSLNNITSKCTKNDITSVGINSICTTLNKKYNLNLSLNSISVSYVSNSNNLLNLTINVDSKYTLSLNSNNANVSHTNNTIYVNNLTYLFKQEQPQPEYLKTPKLTPVDPKFTPKEGYNNQIKIVSAKAYLGITNFATVDIEADQQLPKVKDQYKVYIDGNEQLVNGWFFGDQVDIRNKVEVSQENGQLENHYIRIEILNKDKTVAASTGDMLLVRTTPPPSYQEPILNKDYFIAPWCPSNEKNNPKYWIVNPYTKNEWIKYNYGTLPLPMVEKVDFDDCVNMFTTYALKMYAGQYGAGKRVISSEMMSNAFVEWTCKMWRYFPYFSYNNASLLFHNNPVDKFVTKQDVTGLATISKSDGGVYEHAFLKPFGEFKKFADSLQLFLSTYYRPGMKDLDKVFAAYLFTCDWIKYNGNLFSTVSHYTDNEGVCNNYSQMMSQVLNMMGVPAVPIITNVLEQVQHANVWVYIDKNGDGKKHWYASDPTWSDYSEDGYTGHPVSGCFYPKVESQYWTLFNVSNNDNYFECTFDDDHKNYYQFQGSRWYTPYKNGDVSVGTWSLYNDALLQRPERNNRRSRLNYYKDGWYYLEYKNNNGNYATFKKGNFDQQSETIYIPNTYADIILKGDYYTKYQHLGLAQYGDNLIFMNTQQNEGKDIKIVVHNMNDAKWEHSQIIELPQLDSEKLRYDEKISNFYINADKELVVTLRKSNEYRTFTFKDTVDAINKQNQIYGYSNEEVDFAAKYFEFLSGYLKIGKSNFNVTIEQKQQFFKDVQNILNSKQLSNNDKIKHIKDLYEKYVNDSIKFTDCNIQSFMMPEEFIISNEGGFQKYGYTIPTPTLITNIDELLEGSNAGVVYDIYYSDTSKDKKQMQPLLQKSPNTNITKKDFEKINKTGPDGYYYLRYYVLGQEKNADETSVFKITSDEDWGNQISNIPDSGIGSIGQTFSLTNITKKPGWEENDLYVNLAFGSSLNMFKYDVKWQLKYQNLDDNTEPKVIESGTGTKNNHHIGLATNENHGLYYYEIQVVKKDTNKVINNLFSKFMFVLTEEDYLNFDEKIQNFVNMTNDIIKKHESTTNSSSNISK